jgi:NAD(P)-dependent dehydrogenase (short-subunit alcohol dehydrogenase family)
MGLAALDHQVFCSDLDADGLSDTLNLIQDAGGECHGQPADLTEPDAVEILVRSAFDFGGSLSGLVHVAGGTASTRVPLLDLDLVTFRAMIDRNLTASFLIGTGCARQMVRSGGGSIILTSSIAAQTAFPGLAHYGAAKGGVQQFMRCMAAELAPLGVRVNAIAPGSVLTPGNREFMDGTPAAARWIARTPAGRLGATGEILGAVCYLLSSEASYNIGSTITIDGGYSVA